MSCLKAGNTDADSSLCLCLQELAERYALLLGLPAWEVGGALESIRAQAVKRGKGNKTFRETSVATLELLLPRDSKKVERCASSFPHRVTPLSLLNFFPHTRFSSPALNPS